MTEEIAGVDAYWVVPDKLIAGEYPGALDQDAANAKLRTLAAAGITCFVDLTEEGESNLVPYAPQLAASAAETPHAVEYHRMPIRDVSVPSRERMQLILDLIDEKLSDGYVVYIHCWGGVGRTGAVVGCYLNRHGRASGAGAIPKIAYLRRDTEKWERESPETAKQRRMVTSWRIGD